METIRREEVAFHPASTGRDADGRLFEWRGELLRGVAPPHAADYARLAASETYRRLVERGVVVRAEPAELEVDGYDFVVRHDRLPRVSYPFEWPWPMLKDAGLAVLDLNLELLRDGYVVKDPSPWNVLFDDTRPVYVDFTNIWSIDRLGYALGVWPEWFRGHYTYPLRLAAEGKSRVVRRLAHDYERGISREEMIELGFHLRERVDREARRIARGVRNRVRARLARDDRRPPVPSNVDRRVHHPPKRWEGVFRALRAEVAAVDVPIQKTKWSGYYDRSLSPNAPAEGLTEKHLSVERVLDELRPETVCDIGASTGWFSKLAAGKGASVVVLESDEGAVARLYGDVRREALPILPLVMNVVDPTASYGTGGARVASASERLGGELVIALALVHHLALGGGLDLAHVVDSLAPFARRRLLVEWIDRSDETLLGWFGAAPDSYSEDAFRAALEREFAVLDVLPSHPGTRRLYLCDRR